MLVTKKETNTYNIEINNYCFEQLHEFTYLGTNLNSKNFVGSEIKQHIYNGNKIYYTYGKLMKSKMLSREMKLKTYKTLIRSAVVYGC